MNELLNSMGGWFTHTVPHRVFVRDGFKQVLVNPLLGGDRKGIRQAFDVPIDLVPFQPIIREAVGRNVASFWVNEAMHSLPIDDKADPHPCPHCDVRDGGLVGLFLVWVGWWVVEKIEENEAV